MSRLHFFATGADLLLVLWHLEERFNNLRYVEEGLLADKQPLVWKTASDLPSFGEATGDQEITCDPYLITTGGPIHVQSSLMTNGQSRYDVFPLANPDSVLLRRGGTWKDGSLISGHMIASSDTEIARKLMSNARTAFRQHFTKINAFWVGPEAFSLFRGGTRLCGAIQSPPEYDLRQM